MQKDNTPAQNPKGVTRKASCTCASNSIPNHNHTVAQQVSALALSLSLMV